MTHLLVRLALLATLCLVAAGTTTAAAQSEASQPLLAEVRAEIDREIASLGAALAALRDDAAAETADAAIFHKGLVWALRYDREFTPADVALLRKAIARGGQRTAALRRGETPWKSRLGKLALGYTSRIDGSIQPYGLLIPKDYDPARPARLDVVLHGSTRPVGLSELRFISRFDEGDVPNPSPPEQPLLELHPLGRVENCYRWAGETDVFEAIEDVCRRYRVDRDRIVLRGMSMGASGTWHLGLKHPDVFVALGPYCGYVDTHRFSETPLANFVKVGELPDHQERGLRLLDSIGYAANAGVVPVVACMGEKDVFFQAHVLMAEAMQREGLTLVNLISPGTGHVIDPVTHAEQMRRIGEHVAAGVNRKPGGLRFVTWSLKYGRCHWLQVLGLGRNLERTEISAKLTGNVLQFAEPVNVTRFAIRPALLPAIPTKVRIGSTELDWPASAKSDSPGLVFVRDSEWKIAGELGTVPLKGKRPGLQGPIDDAFCTPFLCVRGTGQPWNAGVHRYAEASLARFAGEWRHYFRGELPVKDDVAVTPDDVRTRNLILFGDPGSNSWIARARPSLPLKWTRDTLRFAGREFSAVEHLPAIITASPFDEAGDHYLVLNSGHTFREAELAKLNYLLFPRWGDWAILKIDPSRAASALAEETVLQAGYFDEDWTLE